jgi:hypothetical protein
MFLPSKRDMIRSGLLTVLVLGCTIAQAFQQDDCQTLFKKVIEKTSEQRKMANEKGFEMVSRIKITQENNQVFTDQMEVRLSGKKYHYKSKTLSMYQDEASLVTIQHDSKVVFITKAQPASFREKQFSQMLTVMDSLQRHMSFQSCSKEFGAVKKGEGYRKIVFMPTAELKAAGIKQIAYWLHEPTTTVRKISISYAAGNDYGLKEYELIVDELSYSYTANPFDGKATQKVLSNNKLRSEFIGYELIDKRK